MTIEQPFSLLQAGRKYITLPMHSWSDEKHSTFVYTMPNDFVNPVSYLSISLNPICGFRRDRAAGIWAYTTKGVVLGDQYFVGTLGPNKLSCFIQIRPVAPDVDGITVFIIVMPESEVAGRIEDQKFGWKRTGPFIELN